MNKEHIFDSQEQMINLIHKVRELKTNEDIEAVGVFGSRVKGTHEPFRSDLDILVINNQPVEYKWSMRSGDTPDRKLSYRDGDLHIEICSEKQLIESKSDIKDTVRWLWKRK